MDEPDKVGSEGTPVRDASDSSPDIRNNSPGLGIPCCHAVPARGVWNSKIVASQVVLCEALAMGIVLWQDRCIVLR